MISVRIIKDSLNQHGQRLTSAILTYPRFIHSELMTHRVFSRNAASSRAIPVSRMIEAIRKEPAMFEYWGSNKKGMQAGAQLDFNDLNLAKEIWLESAEFAIRQAERLIDLGLHKQNANRLLEPFSHMTTMVTCSDWDGFFSLRAHKDAQPEFQVLAYRLLAAYLESTPTLMADGWWHIPFDDKMPEGCPVDVKLKIATARCARLSYLTFDGKFDPEDDIRIHDQLASSGHWSPFEHCAQAQKARQDLDQGNFTGWTQYRKQFSTEFPVLSHHDLEQILANRPDWFQL